MRNRFYDDFIELDLKRFSGDSEFLCDKNCSNCNRNKMINCNYVSERTDVLSASNIDSMYILNRDLLELDVDVADKDKDAIKLIYGYESSIFNRVRQGRFNLLIASPHPGNGKTTSAMRIGLNYIDKRVDFLYEQGQLDKNLVAIFPVLFVEWPNYIDCKNRSYQNGNNYYRGYTFEKFEDFMKKAELLIIDDIGATSCSKQELNTLYTILDYRNKYRLSNIFTSNLAPSSLKELLGDRIYDRAFPSGTKQIIFKDESHREIF